MIASRRLFLLPSRMGDTMTTFALLPDGSLLALKTDSDYALAIEIAREEIGDILAHQEYAGPVHGASDD